MSVEPARDIRDHPLVRAAIERRLAPRHDAYAAEVQRLVDATYRVIERTGSVDPTVRDILREAGLSTQAFYRHFRSKDELLLVLLDDGRRRLVEYLAHRMAKQATAEGQVRAYVEGVMAQAVDQAAASRTRPFVVQQDRLADRFADAQRQSIELLVELLVPPLAALRATDADTDPDLDALRRDAWSVYLLAFASMEQHVRDRTRPARAEIDHLVSFCLRAVGGDAAGARSLSAVRAGTSGGRRRRAASSSRT
ncbi:MAG TPA: helix-turn-helix domain-containing protein [Acidimicrobiales bacterium]